MNIGYIGYIGSLLTIIGLCAPVNAVAQQQALEVGDEMSVRGIVAAQDVALLSVDASAKVNHIPFRVGESFSKDQTLLSFDCTVRRAEASAAKAAYEGSRVEYHSNLELQSRSAVGSLEVELSKARMNESEAMWHAAQGRTTHCTIKAPFDGKVAALSVNEHEISRPDQPIMKIVGRAELELRLVVPSAWLSWLSEESHFTFEIDETNEIHSVSVSRVGAEIDAISGTIELFGRFTNGVSNVIPGMSGLARFGSEIAVADTGG